MDTANADPDVQQYRWRVGGMGRVRQLYATPVWVVQGTDTQSDCDRWHTLPLPPYTSLIYIWTYTVTVTQWGWTGDLVSANRDIIVSMTLGRGMPSITHSTNKLTSVSPPITVIYHLHEKQRGHGPACVYHPAHHTAGHYTVLGCCPAYCSWHWCCSGRRPPCV